MLKLIEDLINNFSALRGEVHEALTPFINLLGEVATAVSSLGWGSERVHTTGSTIAVIMGHGCRLTVDLEEGGRCRVWYRMDERNYRIDTALPDGTPRDLPGCRAILADALTALEVVVV